MNKKVKEGDIIASAYRLVIETEYKNIEAKNTYGMYKDRIYDQKSSLLNELVKLCQSNGFTYGYHNSDTYGVNAVLFFELPDMQQVSFHNSLSTKQKKSIPKYEKEWDGKVNSTMDKISDAIITRYGDELKEYNDTLLSRTPYNKEELRDRNVIDTKKNNIINGIASKIERIKSFIDRFNDIYDSIIYVDNDVISEVGKVRKFVDDINDEYYLYNITLEDEYKDIIDDLNDKLKMILRKPAIPTELEKLRKRMQKDKYDSKKYNELIVRNEDELTNKQKKFIRKYYQQKIENDEWKTMFDESLYIDYKVVQFNF